MAKNATEQRTETDSRIDWGIIFCVLMLALIGLASIYVAATHDSSATSITSAVVSQLVWYVIGPVAIIIIMQFDSEQLWKVAPVLYGLGIFCWQPLIFTVGRTIPTPVLGVGLPSGLTPAV